MSSERCNAHLYPGEGWWLSSPCPSGRRDGQRCALAAGHDGPHAAELSCTREQYARGYAVSGELELHVAVELRAGEDGNAASALLRSLAEDTLAAVDGDHAAAVGRVEVFIAERWPGEERAYFVETNEHNRGLQIYQPYGRPRSR